MDHTGHGERPFGQLQRLIVLAAVHWNELSGAWTKEGSLAEQDSATVAHFTYSYFVNTNEWRLSGRKDMSHYLDPSKVTIDEETGQDTRPITVQAVDLMSEWDAMREGFTKSTAEPVE